MEKLVQSTISSLGYLEKDVYYKEPDCFDSIRDLIRLLHNDDDQLTVRRICSSQNVVKTDLIPIMRADDTSDELFDAALRLTVNLCQPTLIALNGRLPENNEKWHIYYEAERNLARFVNAFVDAKIFDVLSQKCTSYFDLEWEDRSEKSKLLVERIFVLLRFIFAIGTESGRHIQMEEVESCARRKMLLNFFRSKLAPLFLRLSKQPMEREFCLHILAILSLAFKGTDTATLFMDASDLEVRRKKETEEMLADLVDIKKKEERAVRANNKRNFLKGTFVVSGVKALSPANNLIVQRSGAAMDVNPISKLAERKRKRRLPTRHSVANMSDLNAEAAVSTLLENDATLLKAIHGFVCEMLEENCFNKLMRITKDIAFASGRSLTHKYSDIYYHSLTRFTLQFTRAAKLSCDRVSSVFSKEAFHDIITYIDLNNENTIVDKQNTRSHALKMQYAISVFKEMLITINYLLNSDKEDEKKLSKSLCHHIFQTEEYRELGPSLLNTMKPAAATIKILQDLVLANHYYIHIMEKVTRSGELIKVQKAKRITKRQKTTGGNDNDKEKSKSKRKSQSKNNKQMEGDDKEQKGPSDEEIQTMWQAIQSELMDVLTGNVEPTDDVSPINILLKVEDEEHQQFACLQIQMALRDRRVCDAVGIYRAARSLWPETGTFGDDSMGADEECSELHDLFCLDLRKIAKTYEQCMHETYGPGHSLAKASATEEPAVMESDDAGNVLPNTEDKTVDELAEDAEEEKRHIIEIPLDFDSYVMSFSKPSIIYWYVYMLKNFDQNTTELNKALLKLMHRIAFDLKSPSRFYLATLFCIFRRVDECLKKLPNDNRKKHRFFEIYIFGFHLMRKFFEHFEQRGNVMVCELLFTKTSKEAYEIEHGYGASD